MLNFVLYPLKHHLFLMINLTSEFRITLKTSLIHNLYALCTKISISMATVFYPKSPSRRQSSSVYPINMQASSAWFPAAVVVCKVKPGATDGSTPVFSSKHLWVCWCSVQQMTNKITIFLFFPESWAWHFMWIISYGDNSHEMSSPTFLKKKKDFLKYWLLIFKLSRLKVK